VNENRFDINLDGTSTPHRVDKKQRCISMYEGTCDEFIIPLEYERDAMFIDFRPLSAAEQVEFVKVNPLEQKDWVMDSPFVSREVIEVMDTDCDIVNDDI
jgi:hypothetical protein